METRIINRCTTVINQIRNLPTDAQLLGSRAMRKDMASLYRQVMNMGNYYPKYPPGMNSLIAGKLSKKISEGCTACVKRAAMENFIMQARNSLNAYAKTLENFIEGKDGSDYEEDIHNLRPTL